MTGKYREKYRKDRKNTEEIPGKRKYRITQKKEGLHNVTYRDVCVPASRDHSDSGQTAPDL